MTVVGKLVTLALNVNDRTKEDGHRSRMKITAEVLESLGSCGTYTNNFRSAFPVTDERYVDGVEPTVEVCEAQADKFDWSWAAEVMLTSDALSAWRRAIDSDSNPFYTDLRRRRQAAKEKYDTQVEAWRAKYNERQTYPTHRSSSTSQSEFDTFSSEYNSLVQEINDDEIKHYARSFGELFQDDANRSSRVKQAVTEATRVRERREREAVSSLEYSVRQTKSSIARYQRDLEMLIERLPNEEEELVKARAVYTAQMAKRTQRAVVEATESVSAVVEAAKLAAEARVESAKQAAVEAENAAQEAAAALAALSTSETTQTTSTTDAASE